MKEDSAYKAALEAYTTCMYGLHRVKVAMAIEAYLATPDDLKLPDAVKKEFGNIERENRKLRDALHKIANGAEDPMDIAHIVLSHPELSETSVQEA